MPRDASVFVHERALCESDDVGPGTRVHAFAQVMRGASIGRDCNICGHVFVESGARIGNRVTVKNNVMVWDKVEIEDEVFLGPNVDLTNDPNPRAAFKWAQKDLAGPRQPDLSALRVISPKSTQKGPYR